MDSASNGIVTALESLARRMLSETKRGRNEEESSDSREYGADRHHYLERRARRTAYRFLRLHLGAGARPELRSGVEGSLKSQLHLPPTI